MARGEVVDQLSVSPDELSSITGQLAAESAPEADVSAPEAEAEFDHSEPKGFFQDDNKAAAAPAEAPSKLKFRINDAEVELSPEEIQDRLVKAESYKSSESEKARYKREMAERDAKLAEMAQYQANWEKLEALKQDKRALLETITGEDFDELIAREAERMEIKKYGTEEQKRLIAEAERSERLERELNQERETRKREQEALAKQARDNEKQRVATAMEREYFKHKLPDGLNSYDQEVLKDALWSKGQRTIAAYQKQYGTITNKMVAKAFEDAANALYRTTSAQVEQTLKTVREKEKKDAKENAQIASTRQSDPFESADVSKLTPRALFKLFRK